MYRAGLVAAAPKRHINRVVSLKPMPRTVITVPPAYAGPIDGHMFVILIFLSKSNNILEKV